LTGGRLLGVAALLATLALEPAGAKAQAPAQTPRPPTFETGIEIINLTISITDPFNRYVTDLGQKEFAVFEDGVRQELSLFTHENLPISLALMLDTSASMDEKSQSRVSRLSISCN
jgi:hypothetical protein